MRFGKDFLLGTATAAHQVEGNNVNSDFWALENLPNSMYLEPSLGAVDHYNRYEEDIKLMADAGLNAFRFTIEWARIEPKQGEWCEKEVEHYRKVLECCHKHDITPMVCMHHFSSPKWLIEKGGWEEPKTAERFALYCEKVVKELGDLFVYVNTLNEANMGIQIGKLMRDMQKRAAAGGVQMGFNTASGNKMMLNMQEAREAFGCDKINSFHSPLSAVGDGVILQAHVLARNAMKKIKPELKVGITLSLHDMQPEKGGEAEANIEWIEEFTHYLPYIYKDDFIGVQSYSRKIFSSDGEVKFNKDTKFTQMNYEDYPMAIANVVRTVAKDFKGDIFVTENGIATDDDSRRIEFIREALDGLQACIKDGIQLKGYMYWSLLDNYEWMLAFTKTFGLIAVDRKTQKRIPKPSLKFLGSQR